MQIRHVLPALITGAFLFGAHTAVGPAPAQAQDEEIQIGERCRINSSGSEALCDLRPNLLRDIEGVELEDSDGRGVDGANFGRFDQDAPTSILFIVDVSDPRRKPTVDSIKSFILDQIERVDDANKDNIGFAVATFAEEFDLVAGFDDSMREVEQAVGEIVADGRRTELKNAMNEAVAVLQDADEGIRIMVVMTDGKDENPDRISDNSLIDKLDEAGITVFAMGYPENTANRADLRNISLFSDATAGVFVEATIRNKTLPEGFVDDFVGLTTNGGYLRFPLPGDAVRPQFNVVVDLEDTEDDPELRLTVNTNEASQFSESQVSAVVEGGSVSVSSGDGDSGEVSGGLDRILEQIEDLVPGVDPRIVLGVGGGLVAIIVLFLLSGLFRGGKKRKPADTPVGAAGQTDGVDATAIVPGQAGTPGGPGAPSLGSPGSDLPPPPPPPSPQPDRLRQVGAGGIRTPMEPEPVPTSDLPPTADVADSRTLGTLTVVGGSGESYPLTQKAIKIGRGSDNDVVLTDTTVHRQHAVLHLQDDSTFVITDLNTKNGVLVNGVLKDQSALKDDDVIELGEVRLRFEYAAKPEV